MNKKHILTILVASAAFAVSCNSGDIRRDTGVTYAPDMVYSRAYDAYKPNPVSPDSTSLMPVKGTIARDHALPINIPQQDTTSWYALTSPYKFTEQELAEGKIKYDIQCGICHGTALDGNGPLFASGKFAAMPANLLSDNYINFSQGKIYYAIMFGKNVMGSYSSQLREHDRWKVVAYIKQMQSQKSGAPFTLLADNNDVAKTAENVQVATDTAVTAHN